MKSGEMNNLAIKPALNPPPGVTSNFINPETRANEFVITVSIALAVVLVFVSLRLYAKIWVTHSAGWDDGSFIPILLTYDLEMTSQLPV